MSVNSLAIDLREGVCILRIIEGKVVNHDVGVYAERVPLTLKRRIR